MSPRRTWLLSLLLIAAPMGGAHENHAPPAGEARGAHVPGWWKGNTHTHTWWSDGDSPPETVSGWYRDRGYHFLVLSDHNRMQEGELWYPVNTEAKRTALQQYLAGYGRDWVETRERDGVTEVKLKTLDEFRTLFEEKDRFIFIRGMEITDRHHQHPVHLNGVNLERAIIPQGGDSVAQMLQKNIDAVVEQGRRAGRPMFAHVNHPNFYYAITAEDLVALDHAPGDGFVEVYNGHSGVRNDGDEFHPSTERMWDLVLARRLGERQTSVMFGVATDDAHEYTQWGLRKVNPGRGWVMVRAPRLTPDTITAAMKRGDFYNSTGVTLKNLAIGPDGIDIEVLPEPGVDYLIEFIGTKRGTDLRGRAAPTPPADAPGRTSLAYSDAIGAVLASSKGVRARYAVKGDEIYVRARVTSSRLHPNPFAAGDREMAWTQPVVVPAK
jgi:hypothetical protein